MTINDKGETQRFRSDIMEDMVKDEYFNIFQGRQDCYGVRSRESFTIRKKDQKNEAAHFLVKEPLTTEVWRKHFDGTLDFYNWKTKRRELSSLGVYQVVDGKCFFGTVDLDEYDGAIDHSKLAKQIALLKLPLVVCQSASLGAHLHLLLNEWTDVKEVRKTLRQMSDALNFGETEIFPKDSQGEFGYFMNQQYWKGLEDPAFNDAGEVMSYKEFVIHCKDKTISPNKLFLYNLASKSRTKDGELDVPDSRNCRALWIGRYLNNLMPLDWENKLREYNSKFNESPMTETEMQRIIKSVILNNRTPDEIKEKVKSTTSSWRQLFTPIGTMAKMPPIKREYLVEDMLQLGLIVLGGPSTIGKSWFMLQVAHAVASGTMFMGREVKQGNVLYLSMEDTRDDVIKRYEMMGISREELDNLPMMFHTIEQDTIMPTLTKGYEEKVEEWIKDPDIVKPTLLIQDTYQLVYENTAGMDPYQNDVKNLKGIQKVIKSHGVTAIFSAHTTKAKHKKDQWSQLMGSVGKQSTSDQMILMTGDRSTRVNSPVDFSYRGRYGAGHIKLRMDQRCLWQEVDEKDANTGMTERDKKIIDIVKRKKECSPSDVSNEFGYKDSKDRQNIQKCMTKLVNNFHLHKVKSGVYSLSPF